VITIFGYGLGPVSAVSASPSKGRFPTSLGGVQVLVNGAPIPLLYVSSWQINAEIPAPLNGFGGGSAMVQVEVGSTQLPVFGAEVDSEIFGVFQNPDGSMAAINQDGTLNSPMNPAKAGTIVSIWANGLIPFGATVNGSISTAAENWCGDCQIAVGILGDVTITPVTKTVDYAGTAPGLIDGVMQINFTVPKPVGIYDGTTYVNFNGLGANGFIYVTE
jgi:uncharacterized protein (TIGR03437 family)